MSRVNEMTLYHLGYLYNSRAGRRSLALSPDGISSTNKRPQFLFMNQSEASTAHGSVTSIASYLPSPSLKFRFLIMHYPSQHGWSHAQFFQTIINANVRTRDTPTSHLKIVLQDKKSWPSTSKIYQNVPCVFSRYFH